MAVLREEKARLERMRQRFLSRQQFFLRCIIDIETDFHKQYGPYEQDWAATHEACALFVSQIEDYLVDRDVRMIECDLLVGGSADAPTKYRRAQINKRLGACIKSCSTYDKEVISLFDEHIKSVRSVYKMIAAKEECEG